MSTIDQDKFDAVLDGALGYAELYQHSQAEVEQLHLELLDTRVARDAWHKMYKNAVAELCGKNTDLHDLIRELVTVGSSLIEAEERSAWDLSVATWQRIIKEYQAFEDVITQAREVLGE